MIDDLETKMRAATKGKRTFTVDDLRAAGVFENCPPNAIGAIMKNYARAGRIKASNISQSSRPSRRGGWMFRWKWTKSILESNDRQT